MRELVNWHKYIPAGKRHIIFDWNGTLLDDVHYCVKVINSVIVEYGMRQTDIEQYRDLFLFPVLHYYEALGFDFSRVPFETVSDKFTQRYTQQAHDCQLFDGTRELLQKLNSAGICCHILTATHQPYMEERLAQHRLRDQFQLVYGLDNTHAHGKAARGNDLIKAISCAPDSLLLIGDTNHDYEVAKAIGIDALLIADGHQSYERLRSLDCEVLKSRYV